MSVENGRTIGTSSTVTLGIMGTIVVVLVTIGIAYGQLLNRSEANAERIKEQQAQLLETPNRQEITQQIVPIREDIKEIKADIKTILTTKTR